MIASKDVFLRRRREANEKDFDLEFLGLSNKGVKVNKNDMKPFHDCGVKSNVIYRMHAIISRGLYFFHPFFTVAYNTDN